jgi:transcriptional regulator with XRE-family HTH domain
MNLDQLRAKLRTANLSALAARTGINVRTLRRIKNSDSVPSMGTADKIASGLRKASRER